MRVIAAVAVACLVIGVPEVARACSKRHQSIFELFDLATSVAVVKVSGESGCRTGTPPRW